MSNHAWVRRRSQGLSNICADRPGGGDHSDHVAFGIAIQRPVVKHRSTVSVTVSKFQSVSTDRAGAKDLLTSCSGLFAFREAIREVRADEFGPGAAGHSLGGRIRVINLAVLTDGEEGVKTSLQQASIVSAC